MTPEDRIQYAEREIRVNLATRQGYGDSPEWIARDYRRFARECDRNPGEYFPALAAAIEGRDMTLTMLDIEATEDLDFDYDPPCELTYCEDRGPATHRIILAMTCHPLDRLACDPCTQMVRDWRRRVNERGGVYICRGCRSPQDAPVQITPLPGVKS